MGKGNDTLTDDSFREKGPTVTTVTYNFGDGNDTSTCPLDPPAVGGRTKKYERRLVLEPIKSRSRLALPTLLLRRPQRTSRRGSSQLLTSAPPRIR